MSSFEILDGLPFVGVLVVRRRSIIFANSALEKILDWSAAELAGVPLSAIFSEPAFEKFLEPLSQIEAGNFGALKIDIPCRKRNGDDIYCVLSVAQGRDDLIIVSLQDAQNGSAKDALTGLHLRKAFFVLAEHERIMAERLDKAVFLWFVDVDGLKAVNDSLGHEAGNRLILAAADIIRRSFRESDVIARLGGDEFVILAISDPGGEEELLSRIRKMEKRKRGELMGKEGFFVSLSVGVVRCRFGQSLQSALNEADTLMYKDKRKRKAQRK